MMLHVLDVWGDLACFTRPEMKVERFSYPVITPSAARGIFDAIYWDGRRDGTRVRPYFYWQIVRVDVLEIPHYIALRRNEVKNKVPGEATLKRWRAGGEVPEPLWADGGKEDLGTDQKGRTQRQTMALKNVRYRLYARVVPRADTGSVEKFNSCFKRRAQNGKCFQQPYLGCREFPAFFEYVEDYEKKPVPPVPLDQNIGLMLYDVFDLDRDVIDESDGPAISMFEAKLVRGVLHVPPYGDTRVKKSRGD
uniref:CRISPR-associated protein Cas5 n=1 Tax=mine drainage metagenome TaxID=410659 RepID=E6PG16_9ZZZZ